MLVKRLLNRNVAGVVNLMQYGRDTLNDSSITSETYFQAIANLVPDLLWCNDREGNAVWYNQRWLDYTGQTLEAAQGDGWLEVIHPDDRVQSYTNFHKAVSEGRSLRQEHRIRGADGQYRWFLVRAEPTVDENGNVIWFGAATDIHEQRTALEKVSQSEQHLRATIENLPGGAAFVVDRDLRYLLAEGEALAIAGFTPENFVGHTIFEVLSPELIAQYEPLFRAALAGEPFEHEHNAHDRVYISRGTPLRSVTGEVYGVLAVSYDIADRKKAEASLHESEAKYRSLFNSMDEGYFLCDVIFDENDQPVDLFYLDANPSAVRMVGQDFTGRRLREIDPGYEAYWYEIFGRVAQTGQGERLERYAEPDHRWYDFYVFKVGNEESRRVAVVFNDITERKRTEEQLRRAAEMDAFRVELSDALRSLTDSVEIQTEACRILGEQLGVDRAYYVEVNEVEGYARVNQNYLRGDSPSLVGTFRLVDYGWILPHLRQGETIVVTDAYHADIIPEAERAAMEVVKIASHITIPLVKAGVLVGALCVTEATPRQWSEAEVELVRETAKRIWSAIERAYAEAALRKSEEQFRIFVTASSDIVYKMSADWREMRNLEGKNILASTENPSQTWIETYIPQAEQQRVWAAIQDAIRTQRTFELEHQVIHQDGSIGWTFSRAIPILNEQGEIIEWFGTASDVTARKQAEASQIQLIREQAARKEERQRAESLAELDRAKTVFFSNISHEFRTPLTLMLAPLQDALNDRVHLLPPAQQERLELAHRNGLRLLQLVNTLLDFARIEAGRIEAAYEPTDLAQFTTELASVFRSAIEQAGLRFRVDCPPLPEWVYVDRQMWEKIVLNLISNAFKFTWSGEITVTLRAELSAEPQTLAAESQTLANDFQTLTDESQPLVNDFQILADESQPLVNDFQPLADDFQTPTNESQPLVGDFQILADESQTLVNDFQPLADEPQTLAGESRNLTSHSQVILEIRDTGTGIAAEHLPHLFERFYQVRESEARTQEGSGIGLALVSELVRLHGGTIAVSSTLGEGTCFTIVLPFGAQHLPPDQIRAARTPIATTIEAASYVQETELKRSSDPAIPSDAHILLVDDNADMRDYLSRILSASVQVEAVADGRSALLAAQTHPPDLILSDVMMPGLDGFELLHALRSDPHTKEIPLILLSARAGEEAIVEGLQAGADDYLVKPFSAQELISRVTAHLQMAQLRGKALQQERMINRQKDEFISVVSHELNTPLVSILGWTRVLRSTPLNPVMLSKALDTIERNATLQAKLVQDLLDLSRITAGKLRLNPQLIELQPVIETAIATVTQTATDKGIHLTWQENVTEPVVVMGDSDRLRQVLINLLTNAIKFTPESGSVRVELSVINADGSADVPYAEIRVTDTGIGIAADFLPHVFDRFGQAKGANAAKGLGLGLAIAQYIVELHHGTIHASSLGEGQGATFRVRLPLLQN